MSPPLALALLWLLLAVVLAVVPSRLQPWGRACLLVCLGVPLLGWLTAEEGPVAGVLALAAGAVVLRWWPPLRHRRDPPSSRPAE